MSDALDKVFGVTRLPVFPLPLVLLPNEVLPLHIFEPRYQQMLVDVETRRNLFGVTLFEQESEAARGPEPGSVGCVAEVREVNPLPDGRSNILTNGIIRYRLLQYVDEGTPYLVGDIEFFEDVVESKSVLQPIADEVYDLFERVAKAAFRLSGARGSLPDIPKTDPESLSFLVTAAFNLDNAVKYGLLKLTSTSERLRKLREILIRAVERMELNADTVKAAQTNGHANRKIDF